MSEAIKTTSAELTETLKKNVSAQLSHLRNKTRDSRFVLMIALLAAVVASMIVIILWTTSPNYVPLYGKQEMYDAANIMELLEKEKVPFRLEKTSGQILIPEDQLAQVRIALAARGVRAAMPAGMESLDNKLGLGTSEFMENMRYRNAQEGELARTIISLDAIRSARVHLAIPQRTLFVGRNEEKPSASVMLDLKPGHSLDQEQIAAILNLVAGSITGMKPESVTVVDQSGHLLSHQASGEASLAQLSVQQMDYVRRLEDYIRQRSSDMLYPLLGNDNFRIQVAADVDFSKVQETREDIDPDKVLRSESGKEDSHSNKTTSGVPGSLSNRPPEPTTTNKKTGATTPNSTASNNDKNTAEPATERSEFNRQYDSSRTVTHTEYPLGRIRQLSISVLLNQKAAPKQGWSKDQLSEIEDLVKKAAGFESTRQDQFSLASFDFSPTIVTTLPSEDMPWWQTEHYQELLRYGIGALLGLALIFFGIRPLVRHLVSLQKTDTDEANEHTAPATITNRNTASARPFTATDDDINSLLNDVATQQSGQIAGSEEIAIDLDELPTIGSDFDAQLKHLQLLVDKEAVRVTEVIKLWINGNERH